MAKTAKQQRKEYDEAESKIPVDNLRPRRSSIVPYVDSGRRVKPAPTLDELDRWDHKR